MPAGTPVHGAKKRAKSKFDIPLAAGRRQFSPANQRRGTLLLVDTHLMAGLALGDGYARRQAGETVDGNLSQIAHNPLEESGIDWDTGDDHCICFTYLGGSYGADKGLSVVKHHGAHGLGRRFRWRAGETWRRCLFRGMQHLWRAVDPSHDFSPRKALSHQINGMQIARLLP